MPIPAPPADNSGGYTVTKYTNGTDTHTMRLHVRAFDGTGNYLAPNAGSPTSIATDWTAFMVFVKAFYNNAWTFTLTGLFKNNGDGTFTEVFGFTAPAAVTGTSGFATPNDQTRASEVIFNMRDGLGGRGRIILIGQGLDTATGVKFIAGGNAAGNAHEKLVDGLTNPAKTNIVAHSGHQMQSPATVTLTVNRRLRRHYGFQ